MLKFVNIRSKLVTILNLKLVRTFRDNVGARSGPNLSILTIWRPLYGKFEKSLGNIRIYQRRHSDLIKN